MEHEISRRFNDNILHEVQRRFGIAPDHIQELDAFESFIYQFVKNGRTYILRIGHSRRRSAALIRGEVDWINSLADGGASVAQAVLSENGLLVEEIEDGEDGHFLATAFVKAEGGPPQQTGQWNEQLFVSYGRLIGRIHKLSKTYQPHNPSWKRPSWDDPMMLYADKYLGKTETIIKDRYRKLLTHLQHLPKDTASYGMIHQDAHGGNFFVDDNYRITLFDFDDCVTGHFIYDIAMVMFYAITNHPAPIEQLQQLWTPFMHGYRSENRLDPKWFAEILPFMKLREIDLYAVLIDTYGYKETGHPWSDMFMNDRQDKIIREVPYVNFNFKLSTDYAD